ncbi:MAG: PDZ domain-containing protein [Clostridia bacterium]|nr:PDZ domain-containing protein [Clostridia bacterium]
MIINKGIKRIGAQLIALLLLCSLLLTSCVFLPTGNGGGDGAEFSPLESTEEMLANIEASLTDDEKRYSFVSDYLAYWGFPEFDDSKLDWVESVFNSHYNYEGGLSLEDDDILERAAGVGRHFISEYYGGVNIEDREEVTTAVINAYVDFTGDPYAVYRSGEEFNDFNTDMSGKFYGIGVMVEYNHQDESLMVATVYPDSPAEVAGFRVGDFIYAIEGTPISEIGYLNAVNYIRGEKDTPVNVTVLRGDEYVELTAIRDEIVEKSVLYEITDDGYGYIEITTFKGNTDEQFAEAIDFMRDNEVTGIIFDLRNNTGGYLDTVTNMLSYILPTGKLLLTYEYKAYGKRSVTTTDDIYDPTTESYIDSVLDIPMVVLCNEYTASAAEIFTSVIRDYRNEGLIVAKTVGTRTFAKGIMQSTFQTADGSSITLTIAYYNPPSGVNYHGTGITPDVSVENTEETDAQLDTAISELTSLLSVNQ